MTEAYFMNPEQYEAYVRGRARPNAPDVLPVVETVKTSRSVLSVRSTGGFLVRGALRDPGTGRSTEVFYAEPDLTRRKLVASHLMLPVGAHDGPSGRHGPVRWLEHRIRRPKLRDQGVVLDVKPIAPPDSPEGCVMRRYRLGASSLDVSTTVVLRQGDPDTSIGHHDYYHLQDGDPTGLTVNGQSIDELLGEPGATDAIMAGEAHFWSGFNGTADVRMPNGMRLGITAEAAIDGQPVPGELGMLIWHRPGTSSLGLETTMGVKERPDGSLQNDRLSIDRAMTGLQVVDYNLAVTTTLLPGVE